MDINVSITLLSVSKRNEVKCLKAYPNIDCTPLQGNQSVTLLVVMKVSLQPGRRHMNNAMVVTLLLSK